MATKTKKKTPSPPVEYASGQSGPKGLSPQAQTAKPQDAGETRDRAQSATGAGRGMDKLRDEMAKNGGRYVQVVGEYMTAYLLQHPEAEAAILTEGKTIAGSLKVMEAEARKVKTGNVAVLDDRTAFGIVLQYYGIEEEQGTGNREKGTGNRDIERPENSPVDCFQRDGAGRPLGTGIAGQANEMPDSVEAPAPTEEAHVTDAAPDPFDLDALLGVI